MPSVLVRVQHAVNLCSLLWILLPAAAGCLRPAAAVLRGIYTPLLSLHPAPCAGDVNSVSIGEKTSVQENVVIHVAKHNVAAKVGGDDGQLSKRAGCFARRRAA